jgi:hypothetical protein
MKKIASILFYFGVGLISLFAQSTPSKIMYVDYPEGLPVRNTPNITGERICLLKNKSEVEILKINKKKVNIDGIPGNWIFVKTGETEGWVFGGYLIQDITYAADNWLNCRSYKYIMQRSYPVSIEETNYIHTSAFEFVSKMLKQYFYPNVTTENFYLSFYYPLVNKIPEFRNGLFEETEIEIQEDVVKHHIKYTSSRINGNSYFITIGQHRNNMVLKEMQFTVSFFDDHIEVPELIDSELEQKIKLLDMLTADMKMKIENAYTSNSLENIDSGEGIFSNIIVERFDLENLMNTDFSERYIEVLRNNGIFLNETDKEILKRLLHGEVLNYK